jgi:transposase
MMRFYQEQHPFYCGIDLHAKTMYVCIVNQAGEILVHRDVKTRPDAFLRLIEPYREGLVVGVECMFSWYWLSDLCDKEGIDFVLGHALYMKAIHGGKSKNDKIDSEKIAMMLRGGMMPIAYVYPKPMRATRDLLRRRMYLVRTRAEALAHIQNTNTQYNLPDIGKRICYSANREGVAEHFPKGSVRRSVELDLALIDQHDEEIRRLELHLSRNAKVDDPNSYYRLRSVPGVGKILSLVMLYEIHRIGRFPRVGNFLSYARLVRCTHESAGKRCGSGSRKIGNAHLKWAFSEATLLFMRSCPEGKRFVAAKEKKHGKGKALSILSAKLGRGVYYMLKRKEPFNLEVFLRN